MNLVITLFMLLMGVGMVGIWLVEIVNGRFIGQGKIFYWRNEAGDLMWPHLLAEFLTAVLLITGAIGLLIGKFWSFPVSLLAFGALIYTSINSLSWALSKRERIPYAIPMLIGLFGSIIILALF